MLTLAVGTGHNFITISLFIYVDILTVMFLFILLVYLVILC